MENTISYINPNSTNAPIIQHNPLNDFIKCGVTGWCIEVFWTGLVSFFAKDRTLKGNSSLIMFPIYGSAALIRPLSHLLKKENKFIRGLCYAGCIISTEYITGSFLKKHGACPWDYSKARLNYKGIIRLDYFPLWFIVGLMYEKILEDR